jgi:plastocyanin
MSKVLMMLVTAALVLTPIYIIAASAQSLLLSQQQNSAYAQVISADNNNTDTSTTTNLTSSVHPDIDSSPITEVIVIGKDMQGNVAYMPNNVTVKVGEEILIVNNGTDAQSVTNGMSPDDPLAGRLFDTGPIPPGGFAEYVASNLSPGNYSFYSTSSTSTIGVLIVESNS